LKSIPSLSPFRTAAVRRGFALVVTLSLMILLTIIAVGLLSLASVTLRSSSAGDAGAIARANARLSLMLAIGELQKEMGPDSRISAPHDAGTESKGGQPRWTAVYDAWKTPEDPTTPETPDTRDPKFRSWLVSNATDTAAENILLAGSNSLKKNSAAEEQIKAPSMAVKTGKTQGRFAWWISDESLKAKINAGLENSDGKEVPANPLADAQSPPNVGHKTIPELSEFEWKPGTRSLAITHGVVNLAAGLEDTGIGGINHDITVHSAGVLCDVRAGRLKRDLSNLLSRPVEELENKPLYLANGRMNRFDINDSGAVSNSSIPANAAGANRYGINLEELHLFHQLHREIDWSAGKPKLVSKNSLSAINNDRYKIYRHPLLEATHFIYSLRAVPDGGNSGGKPTYKMQMYQDAMISYSNPNDIAIEWPSGLRIAQQIHSLPYKIRWNIRRNGAAFKTSLTKAQNSVIFEGRVEEGFRLEPGEAAVFGKPTSTGNRPILQRGFAPKGESVVVDLVSGKYDPWDLRAGGLLPTDSVNFTLQKITDKDTGASGLLLSKMLIAGNNTSDFGLFTLNGPTLDTPSVNRYLLPNILPPSVELVDNYIRRPMGVLMISYLKNVERSMATGAHEAPEAFPSRPFHMIEPSITDRKLLTESFDADLHSRQWLFTAERMPEFLLGNERTLPSGKDGKNVFHGGSREISFGSFNVIKRRIPLSAPLSLGAFENAIACGLTNRTVSTALSGKESVTGSLAKAIGNSWSSPFIASDAVFGVATDHSWMANTALWDSWFLSGIVDGEGTGSNPYQNDDRSQLEQFKDLAENTGTLRNRRLAYNSRLSSKSAMEELFDGDVLKPNAISKLSKFLLIDGPFNVNSTSISAWKAFLSSVRDQELIDSGGGKSKKNLPFGTLGYAAYSATSGNEGDWNGIRDLSDSELQALASAIVEQVKERGPFLSMADFVNRRPNSNDQAHQALGALQMAIDKSGLNNRYEQTGRKLNATDISVLAGSNTLTNEPTQARAVGCAGYLSQAALLSPMGPQITVRGDTFVIRTYGDSRDASGRILAKAWCEAVVQRIPEYLDSTNAPDTSATLTNANATFGRKFDIISFRWLDAAEIS
jgi:hypothetical protein